VAGVRATPPGTIAVSSLKAEVKRSISPETRLAGMKRKVDDVNNAQVEGDETPPFKRVALSIHN
jgi:pre-mRNA cleavage complex 2 protein Pcf11